MRNKFFENYILSNKELIKHIWNDAIIVLDANVLLNLYRYSEENKENLLNVLELYKDRLWIPYQVGWEYHQNRISVYSDIDVAYEQIATSLENGTSEFLKKLDLSKYSRHPKIDITWFENQIKSSMGMLCDHLRNIKNSCSANSEIDVINERVAELFDGKVGDDFDESKLYQLYNEGQIRYGEKIPPGYCDAKKKKDRGNRHLYGDLIWWKQVIEYARENERNVILVTDDTKEDWYEKVKGKTIGPRKELIKEFREESLKDILIYPTHRFLEYAKENMSVSVNQETIAEANEIHRENEAIDDIMSSVSEENEESVAKMFSENPWMSAESFLQSCLKTIENSSATVLKYSDILGKDYLSSPLENLSKLTPDYSAILGKSAFNPVGGMAAATKLSDMLEKDYLSSPLENLSKLTPDYSAILGKSAFNPVGGMAAATKLSDMLGKDYLSSPLENLSKLTPDYSAILSKSAINPVWGMAATTKLSDILGKDYLSSPLENLSKLAPDYSAILGKSALNPIGDAETLSSSIGMHSSTTSMERKDDKSTSK